MPTFTHSCVLFFFCFFIEMQQECLLTALWLSSLKAGELQLRSQESYGVMDGVFGNCAALEKHGLHNILVTVHCTCPKCNSSVQTRIRSKDRVDTSLSSEYWTIIYIWKYVCELSPCFMIIMCYDYSYSRCRLRGQTTMPSLSEDRQEEVCIASVSQVGRPSFMTCLEPILVAM